MKTCVIVDAYGPGMFLPQLIKEQGFDIIHVSSTSIIPAPFKNFIDNAGFKASLACNDNLTEIIDFLKLNNVSGIIPGFETGVMIADILSEKLHLSSNGTPLSAARRNKSLMIDALRSKNIPTVDYLKTHNIKTAIEWANSKTRYPVVAKPVDSASSEDVYICHNNDELNTAFEIITSKINLMGSANNEVLVQTFLQGTEYVVNTVSCEGKHYVTDMWECKKRIVDNRVIYDKEALINFEGAIQSKLSAYIFQALDALNIKFGAAHSEVMLTSKGPILIETGARIGGAVNHQIHSECFGHSQLELNVDAILNPKQFFEKIARPYAISKFIYVVMAISNKEGVIKDIKLEDNIKNSLPSYQYMRLKKQRGDRLQKTIDLSSSPATIFLSSSNKQILEADYQKLLVMVDEGFIIE